MDRKKRIEQSVSDAMIAKPICFSITYKENKKITTKVTKKQSMHKYLPFFYKSIENQVSEKIEVEKVRKFEIHPPTLGKMQILSKLYLQLDFDEEALQKKPHIEAMKVCASHTDIVSVLMAISVMKTEKELLNNKAISDIAEFFKWHCTPADFASCLLAILTQVDYVNFMTSMRLTKMLRLNKPTEKRADRIE